MTNETKLGIRLISNDKIIYYKSESKYRWLILILGILQSMTSYYCNDIPVPLSDELIYKYNLTNIQYSLFHSVCNYPDIIMSLFIGILVDKIGTNVAFLIFFIFHLIGHGLFVVGSYISSLYIMLIGRGIFGLARLTDLIIVKILALWFVNKELATALALIESCGRVGGIISINTLLPIYHELNDSMPNTLWIGFGVLCIGLISVIWMLIIDNIVTKRKEMEGYIVPTV